VTNSPPKSASAPSRWSPSASLPPHNACMQSSPTLAAHCSNRAWACGSSRRHLRRRLACPARRRERGHHHRPALVSAEDKAQNQQRKIGKEIGSFDRLPVLHTAEHLPMLTVPHRASTMGAGYYGPPDASYQAAPSAPYYPPTVPAYPPYGAPSYAPYGAPSYSPYGAPSYSPYGAPSYSPYGGPPSRPPSSSGAHPPSAAGGGYNSRRDSGSSDGGQKKDDSTWGRLQRSTGAAIEREAMRQFRYHGGSAGRIVSDIMSGRRP
jgi:hypothetical protein